VALYFAVDALHADDRGAPPMLVLLVDNHRVLREGTRE
jgi:hypothetical protein